MEKTLVILKPDAVERKLVGEIIRRFEDKNLNIVQMKMAILDRKTAEEHYSHIKSISIYDEMIDFIIGGPVVILIIEGEEVIKIVRNMVGKTSSIDSPPGTIRGDLSSHRYKNLIHASDSYENAEIEIKRFFLN